MKKSSVVIMKKESKNRKTPPDASLEEEFENPGQKEREDEYRISKEEKTKTRKHLLRIFIGSIWPLWFVASVFLLSWSWHVVSPIRLHYLGDSQLDVIEKILITIGSCGIVVNYFRRQLPN